LKVSGPNLISNFVGRVDYGSSKATCGGRAAGTVAGFLVQEEGDGAILLQGGRQRRQRPSAASRFSFLHGLAEAFLSSMASRWCSARLCLGSPHHLLDGVPVARLASLSSRATRRPSSLRGTARRVHAPMEPPCGGECLCALPLLPLASLA